MRTVVYTSLFLCSLLCSTWPSTAYACAGGISDVVHSALLEEGSHSHSATSRISQEEQILKSAIAHNYGSIQRWLTTLHTIKDVSRTHMLAAETEKFLGSKIPKEEPKLSLFGHTLEEVAAYQRWLLANLATIGKNIQTRQDCEAALQNPIYQKADQFMKEHRKRMRRN